MAHHVSRSGERLCIRTFRWSLLGLHARYHVGCYFLFCKLLDLFEQFSVSVGDEGEGDAARSGSSGSSDPMDVIFSTHRKIKVDHVADRPYIDASCGDISCNEDSDLSISEPPKSTRSLPLVHIAVEGRCIMTNVTQFAHKFISVPFGGNEDNGLVHRRIGKQVFEQILLVGEAVDEVETLFNIRDSRLFRLDGNFDGVCQKSLGKFEDRTFEGGRATSRFAGFSALQLRSARQVQ